MHSVGRKDIHKLKNLSGSTISYTICEWIEEQNVREFRYCCKVDELLKDYKTALEEGLLYFSFCFPSVYRVFDIEQITFYNVGENKDEVVPVTQVGTLNPIILSELIEELERGINNE